MQKSIERIFHKYHRNKTQDRKRLLKNTKSEKYCIGMMVKSGQKTS